MPKPTNSKRKPEKKFPLPPFSYLLTGALIGLALDTGLIAGLLISRLLNGQTAATITDIGPLLVGAGVLTALATFLVNLRRGRSEDLLDAAIGLLEKAYEKLEPEDGSNLPSNSRRSWLSSARLAATAERLAAGISENSHRLIYEETKEHWRTRLHELIFPSTEGLPSSFYAENPEHMISWSETDRDPLSEKSLAFLYRFIRWPDDAHDPLSDEPNFTDDEIEKMRSFGPRGLGDLLSKVRRLQQPESEQ